MQHKYYNLLHTLDIVCVCVSVVHIGERYSTQRTYMLCGDKHTLLLFQELGKQHFVTVEVQPGLIALLQLYIRTYVLQSAASHDGRRFQLWSKR